MAIIGVFLRGRLRFSRASIAVVDEVSLEVPLTFKPDPAYLTGKNVFYKKASNTDKQTEKYWSDL